MMSKRGQSHVLQRRNTFKTVCGLLRIVADCCSPGGAAWYSLIFVGSWIKQWEMQIPWRMHPAFFPLSQVLVTDWASCNLYSKASCKWDRGEPDMFLVAHPSSMWLPCSFHSQEIIQCWAVDFSRRFTIRPPMAFRFFAEPAMCQPWKSQLQSFSSAFLFQKKTF